MAPTNKKVESECENNAWVPDAFRSNNVTSISNQCISVTPPFLKFPHDNPTFHIQRITVFNKSKRLLEFRAENPGSRHFTIFYEKSSLPPGVEATVIIKCKPYDQKMCFETLRISVSSEIADALTIPLELFPSAEWFGLPKAIHMPIVSIGERSVKIINLPMPPPGEQPYHFVISGDKPEALTVTPNEGKIGAPLGPKELLLVYCPKEFTTLQYKMSVHFPQIESQPFECTIYMKCSPSEPAKKYPTPDMCKLAPKAKLPMSKLKLAPKPVEHAHYNVDDCAKNIPDLLTPAGVMKFLMQQKGAKSCLGRVLRGPTGLSWPEEEKIYKTKLKDFQNQLNKMEIREKTLVSQHTRIVLGQDPIDQNSELWNEIQQQNEFIRREYQKSLGMQPNDLEDLTRRELKLERIRPVRDINYDLPERTYSFGSISNSVTSITPQLVDPKDPFGKRWAKRFFLRKFVQAAFRMITQKRADRRIAKLKILVQEVKESRKKIGENGERLESDEVGINRALVKIHNMIKKSEANAAARRAKEISMAQQTQAKRIIPARPLGWSSTKSTSDSNKYNLPTLEQIKSIFTPKASRQVIAPLAKPSKTIMNSEQTKLPSEIEKSVKVKSENEEKSSNTRKKSSKSPNKGEKTEQDERLKVPKNGEEQNQVKKAKGSNHIAPD